MNRGHVHGLAPAHHHPPPVKLEIPEVPKPKKKHGWEEHGTGEPPFPGAAPPIHLHQGGRFLGKGRIPKKGKKKGK